VIILITFNGKQLHDHGGHKNKHQVFNHRTLIPYILKECGIAPKRIFNDKKRYELDEGVDIVFNSQVIQYQINDVNINITPSWKEKNQYFWKFETDTFEITPFKINRYNIAQIMNTLGGMTAENLEKWFKGE